MLAAEPENVRSFVASIKDMLVNYHSMPSLNSLSLIELPTQTKSDQWERTMILSTLFRIGPSAIRYLPTSWSYKLFDRMVNQYLNNDLFKNNLQALIDCSQIRDMLLGLIELSTKAQRYQPELSKESSFKMHRLLWALVFFGKSNKYSDAVLPYSALYPLVDDLIDSPNYSKLNKTRLMERIHSRLGAASLGPMTPPASSTIPSQPEEVEIDKCVSELVIELQRLDPITRNEIILSLDIVRYAEELDFMNNDADQSDVDIYTRCAVKGAATLRSLLMMSGIVLRPSPNRWSELIMVYGFIMQMIDDLQDCELDQSANILTPFSDCLKRRVNLDSDIIKLVQFIKSPYMDTLMREGGGPLYGRLCLLNSLLLYVIMEATVKHRSRLSVQLYKDVRHRIPVTKAWIKRHSLEHEAYDWLTSIPH